MVQKKLAAAVLAATLGLGGFSGGLSAEYSMSNSNFHEEPTPGEMFADVVAVRPMMLIVSAVGAATWVVSLPFSLAGGNAGEAGQALVLDPLAYTFTRPVGEMNAVR